MLNVGALGFGFRFRGLGLGFQVLLRVYGFWFRGFRVWGSKAPENESHNPDIGLTRKTLSSFFGVLKQIVAEGTKGVEALNPKPQEGWGGCVRGLCARIQASEALFGIIQALICRADAAHSTKTLPSL